MKTWVLALIALTVGLAIGGGIVGSEFMGAVSIYPVPDAAGNGSPGERTAAKVLVEGGEKREDSYLHNFGTMDFDETGTYVFTFRNVGTAPLELTKGEFTCSCTIANLSGEPIPPGGSTEVTLEWKPKVLTDHFAHGGVILTNDPSQPSIRISVEGRIAQAVRLVPPDVFYGAISSSEPHESIINVYDYRGDGVKITKHEFEKPEGADMFDVEFRPLSGEEVKSEPGAKGGVAVVLTTKPGLPLGPINQKIRLTVQAATTHELAATIEGRAVGDITFTGSGFDSERSTLKIGAVPQGKGVTKTIHVMIKGPHRNEVELRIAKISPENSLQATLGEPRELNNGAVIMVPMQITVPSDAPLGDYLGARPGELGSIELETTHPDAKQAHVYVSFLVEKAS